MWTLFIVVINFSLFRNKKIETKETPVQQTTQRAPLHRGSSAHLQVSGNETYTDEEKRVLLHTSHINGRSYVPFMSVDLAERFQYTIPFTDKDGYLPLSPKQRQDFYK